MRSPQTGRPVSRKPLLEVADIFRQYSVSYCDKHNLPLSHLKVIHEIEVCRTAALGGHRERCDSCGFERNAYNSCRNRHCPKCQALAKAKWLEKRKSELIPVKYFHAVFTLPHELNPLVLCNKKEAFDLLFKTVPETIEQFAIDPNNGLGGKIGFIAILHTWDQKLLDHIHLHCLIPAGVLAFDGSCWIHTKKDFLFPVRALSKVFRGKFIDYLKKSYSKDKFIFPGTRSHLGTKEGFSDLINRLWKKEWVVYSKASFSEPEKVLEYLGLYTHRIAIANHRIFKVENGFVTFWYKDRKNDNERKTVTVSAEVFIRRFLLHVLPPAYRRIRHYGFLANRCKKQDLTLCKKVLGYSNEVSTIHNMTIQEMMLQLTGIDVVACPCCNNGRLKKCDTLPKIIVENRYIKHTKPGIDDSS